MVVRLLDYQTLELYSYTKAQGQHTFCGWELDMFSWLGYDFGARHSWYYKGNS
jgi:hypothetical protein